MNKTLFIILLSFIFNILNAQNPKLETQTKFGEWDQGVPILPQDPHIMGLINQLGDSLREWEVIETKSKAKICREIGLAFYDKGLYDAADFYLTKSRNFKENPKAIKDTQKILEISIKKEIEKDIQILEKLPPSYESLSRKDLKNIVVQVEKQIKQLVKERDSLIVVSAPNSIIESKNMTINTLEKEKDFAKININNFELKDENRKVRNYLFWAILSIISLVLAVVAIIQRKTIRFKDREIEKQLKELSKKNTYLEHAARIIRHDMHSGINTYIPKGISSLERKITEEEAKNLKIESSIKMIREGLNHTQRVYKSVYEFTNLVKKNIVLEKNKVDIKQLLHKYFENTSYKSSILIGDLGEFDVNEILFCNAIDNLVRNGLKYNDSETKFVKIYRENNSIVVQDNGRGLSQKEFDNLFLLKYNKSQALGLNICKAILEEHGFKVKCEKNEIGTKMKINLK